MTLQDLALSALAIAGMLVALGVADRWARPRPNECEPLPERDRRRLPRYDTYDLDAQLRADRARAGGQR